MFKRYSAFSISWMKRYPLMKTGTKMNSICCIFYTKNYTHLHFLFRVISFIFIYYLKKAANFFFRKDWRLDCGILHVHMLLFDLLVFVFGFLSLRPLISWIKLIGVLFGSVFNLFSVFENMSIKSLVDKSRSLTTSLY